MQSGGAKVLIISHFSLRRICVAYVQVCAGGFPNSYAHAAGSCLTGRGLRESNGFDRVRGLDKSITDDTPMSRINSNLASLQAQHTLARNQTDLSTRLQRLSTGLKINTGKDAPAGLIASETLRSEISGIHQAIDNSQRADNVINTAGGGPSGESGPLLGIQGPTQ